MGFVRWYMTAHSARDTRAGGLFFLIGALVASVMEPTWAESSAVPAYWGLSLFAGSILFGYFDYKVKLRKGVVNNEERLRKKMGI